MAHHVQPLPTNNLNGIRYYDDGPAITSGQPYLLLHGLGNSLNFWTAVAPTLAEKSRTVAIDIPGFGQSEQPADGFTLQNISRDVLAFLDNLEIGPCILVAHSLGGTVALRLASLKPELVSRIVLVDAMVLTANTVLQRPSQAMVTPALSLNLGFQFAGGVLPIQRRVAKLISATPLSRSATLWPFLYSPKDVDPKLLEIALSNNGGVAVVHTLCQARSVHLSDLMSDVSQTVDLVWGARDRLLRREDLIATRRLLTIDRELAIPACGHWPMIETPEILSKFILGAQYDAA